MPLVEYVGNATSQDNTEVVQFADGADGQPRSISRGKRALLSGNELRSMASHYQVKVVEETGDDNTDLDEVPTEMPDGYDKNGYKEGETPSGVVYTAEAYPDEESSDEPSSLASAASPSSVPATPSASPPSGFGAATSPSPPSPSTPASPGASG